MNAPTSNQVKIGGSVTDAQIAVGSYILQIGDVNGGVVNVAPPAAPIKFERHTKLVSLKPRSFPSLLDREAEASSIKSAINTSTPVTLFGESGSGKTSLLRNVLNAEKFPSFPDGLIYLAVHEQGLEDILQLLFDSFFSTSIGVKPTDGQIHAELNKIKGLIALDDIALSREDAMSLLDTMPQSLFILASESRSLWGEGQVIALGGLPKADGVMLFSRELGHEPSKDESSLIEQICTALHGNPFRILEMASLAREGKSLQEILNSLQGTEPDSTATALVFNSLDKPKQTILGVLGSLGGTLVSLDHLRELASVPNLENTLSSLSSLGLIQADGSKYGIASSIISTLPRVIDLRPWDNAVVKHFANWSIQNPGQDLLEDAAEALVKAIQKAGEQKEWPEVVRIGRVLERILILKKRWQSWADILDLILRAARTLGDRKLEGWALHQLGSRAMCTGASEAGRELLSQALQIRKAIGDQAGIRLSQHNLNVLLKILPVPKSSGCRRWFNCGVATGAGGLVVAVAIIVYIYTRPVTPPPPPVSPVTHRPTITPTFTPSATASATSTETPTPTATFTPTITDTPVPVILYDFIEHAPKAQWDFSYGDPIDGFGHQQFEFTEEFVGTSKIPDPVYWMDYNKSAFAGWENYPPLEDDSKESKVVLAYPYGENTSTRGIYDLRSLTIDRGDQLILRVGYRQDYPKQGLFQFSILSDGLEFVVSFEENEKIIQLADIHDSYDKTLQERTIDLNSIVGGSGNFILEVKSGANTYSDYAVWAIAYLQRP